MPLTRAGLAKVADWSIGVVTVNRDKFDLLLAIARVMQCRYRVAEKAARDGKKRLWKDFSAAPKATHQQANFTGVVRSAACSHARTHVCR